MKISVSERLTSAELVQEQSSATKHLTFSMTLACPLKCAHCIVEAGPDKGHTTMPLEVAKWYASQMPELHEYGIRMLSFTGGEPLMARPQLKVMSEAADAVGMFNGVVTAAQWATSAKPAERVVKAFPGLHLWDISLDTYHGEFVAFERVRTAYQTVKNCGRQAMIRFAYHEPFTPEDEQAMEFVDSFADPYDVSTQRVRSVGRAIGQPVIESTDQRTFVKPCMTKGLVIRYDGSTSPCCTNLVEERRHPFQFGDPRSRPLREMHADYVANPLLQMIRVLGFGEIVEWLKKAGLESVLPEQMPQDVCDLCPHIMTNKIAANLVSELCARPDNRLKIAVLADQLLGEPQMLQRTIEDLRGASETIDGFSLAEMLAEKNASANATVGENDAQAG
jgi:pyruvate-formate lyase-activating enzyme